MIIVGIIGGLGNQLFCYACGYATAKRVGAKLMLDTSILDNDTLRDYELDKLGIRYDKRFSTASIKSRFLREAVRRLAFRLMRMRCHYLVDWNAWKYNKRIEGVKDHTYLLGYWQSEKYFKHLRGELLEMFKPRIELSSGCRQYVKEVEACNSVSVHVRRGDYVTLGFCLPASYYEKALARMEKLVEEPVWFVFSDDLDYCRKLFAERPGKFVYVHYESTVTTIEDMYIMSRCKHNVVANSSYSWWGAWLNSNPEKIVIAPSRWMNQANLHGPILDSWIRM